MTKNLLKTTPSSFERKALVVFSFIFVTVVLSAWIHAAKLQKMVSTSSAVVNVDVRALIEIERIRNIADSQIANARAYFLLGSSILLDQYYKDKQNLMESLVSFEKQYPISPQPEIVERIGKLQQQQQNIFEQGMEFREKKTESKIVGQFYQSKARAIRAQISETLDEVMHLYNAELDRARARAHQGTVQADVQIREGLLWMIGLVGVLFLGMAFLVIRMLSERGRQIAERNRLYEEATKAVLARDGIIAAISHDLKEPLNAITQVAESVGFAADSGGIKDRVEFIKSSVKDTERLITDIVDQSAADLGNLALRLDQLSLDTVLDEARLVLQPIAKQRDIRLQFDSVNPPVLAFLDRERVMRVLLNLVGNAIKFSPKQSKVVIKVRSDQQFVFISVTDSGPGIPEKQISQIFDHFWQARKTGDQGAGIGLSVVKTIVAAHGGTVKVDSVGYGSTFTFSLPRRRPVGAQLNRSTVSVKQVSRPQAQTDSVF